MKNAPNLNLTARSDTPRAAEPIALTAEQIHLVSGGLNPQPLPPGHEDAHE